MAFRVVLLLVILAAARPVSAQSGNASPAAPAEERLTFSGDFRARFEGFYRAGEPTRQRGRFRLRLGLRAILTEGLNFNVRVASGDGADVTSTNQSLTDFWNRKPLNIDQVALIYNPPEARALTVGGGKFAYPVTRTQMAWDDDVNWEGAFEQVAWAAGPVAFRAVAVQSPLSDVGGGADAFMFGEYLQAMFRLGGHAVQLSIADYAFKEADQLAVALDQRTAIRTQQTNRVRRNAAGQVIGYASAFNLVDAIAQMTFDTGRPQYPLTLLADYVVNTRAADDEDSGIWLVGSYGRAASVKAYSVSYTFARIERDAVVSAFNFSDMGPASNVVMNMASFSFMPINRLNLDATAIFTRRLRVPAGDPNALLKRIQVDARISF
ncbi:MAG TPA: putative porin [Vicinamibacterales bacterium]|nr:putative porin [Vicinamibacterales bacterium]